MLITAIAQFFGTILIIVGFLIIYHMIFHFTDPDDGEEVNSPSGLGSLEPVSEERVGLRKDRRGG